MSCRQILGTIVVLTASASLFADSVMEEVVVTAQKKEENIQESFNQKNLGIKRLLTQC